MIGPMEVAFRRFYDEHVRFVWRSLLRLGVPEKDVPDVAQDVFVVAYRRLPEFEGRSKATTWLFAICLRVASDRRKAAHRSREVPASAEHEASGEAADEAGAAERRQAARIIERILARMPEEQRIVFFLFELEELTAEEIADALEIPVGTVRSRLRLARAAFRGAVARIRAREEISNAWLDPAEVLR
jgi:RNA polymerase sigma-70 factor (ECF subfamily)